MNCWSSRSSLAKQSQHTGTAWMQTAHLGFVGKKGHRGLNHPRQLFQPLLYCRRAAGARHAADLKGHQACAPGVGHGWTFRFPLTSSAFCNSLLPEAVKGRGCSVLSAFPQSRHPRLPPPVAPAEMTALYGSELTKMCTGPAKLCTCLCHKASIILHLCFGLHQ